MPTHTVAHARTVSPAIADYAIVGDCRSVALIARDGSVDWLCLPHFSDPSVFAALLDPDAGGHLRTHPVGEFQSARRYVDDTAVLETIFTTDNGTVRMHDLMPLAQGRGTLEPQREFLRLVECIAGRVTLAVDFAPRPDYGRARVQIRHREGLGFACARGAELFLLHTDMELAASKDHAHGYITLHAGERRALSLLYAGHAPLVIVPLGDHARERCDTTIAWWQQWTRRCVYRGPCGPTVHRSMITLKLLTSAISGAVVAAPTTSLPEHAGGDRNWDYRYCWLRDAARTLEAFEAMGYHEEAEGFLGWLLHATRLTRPELQVVYDIFGEARIPEYELHHLRGYRDSRPVRIGNGAWRQCQLDVYGEVVQAAWYYAQAGGRLDPSKQKILIDYGEVVCRRWREPDHGIWEFRTEPRHNTFSKVMCWVALHCLVALARAGHLRIDSSRYLREMSAIRNAVDFRAYRASFDAYAGSFDADWADASLLLLPRYGFISADHPRMRNTYAYIERHLREGALFYRYPRGSDGLPAPEGAFAACSFWAVDYLVRAGRLDEARALFEQALRLSNDVGLFSEEYAQDGSATGNFPQAFTHAGVITAALTLQAAGAQL